MTGGPSAEDALSPPRLTEIEAAAERLRGFAVKTPLLESDALNRRVGGRVLVKAESLQRTGSFKFRGAFNRMSLIPSARRELGVIAFSSGNHAQGVAAAAALMGLPATILMPADAPAVKRRNTEAYGARVLTFDRARDDREALGAALARETGATLIRPYDDAGIIAGQGTVGLEIARSLEQDSVAVDAVLAPCGGGGLIAGVATAIAALTPRATIWACEPEEFDDTARSLAYGARLRNRPGGSSIADALMAPTPGALTFAINRRLLAGGMAVSEAAIGEAMRVAFETLRLVLEPGGAVALAAILSGRIATRGRTLVAVASGGNVDPALYADILRAA